MTADPKMVIVVRKDLQMRKGKIAAQSSHAASEWFMRHIREPYGQMFDNEGKVPGFELTDLERDWIDPKKGNIAKIVVGCDSELELRTLMQAAFDSGVSYNYIMDEGRTEFHGVKTLTCCAFGPALPEDLDPLTGHLKLL